jgi:hypothetical protein
MSAEAIEAEVVALVPASTDVSLGTLHATSPQSLVESASALATTLARVIEAQKLYSNIQGRRHVKVEGWTTLAVMLGCVPREVAMDALEDGSYVATVELVRMRDGVVLSRATSECGMDEPTWSGRARYARRSMAATRATGKACRLAFSWIMAMAGYDPTPLEEMPHEERDVTPLRAPAPFRQAEKASGAARKASDKQIAMIWAKAKAKGDTLGVGDKDVTELLKRISLDLGFTSSKDWTMPAIDSLVKAVEAWTLASFGSQEPPENDSTDVF